MGKFYLFFLLFYCPQIINAQAFLKLKVIDAETKQPVEGATIAFKGTEVSGVTDKAGLLFLKTYQLNQRAEITFIGFKTKEFVLTEAIKVIELERANLTLENVVLTGSMNENHFTTLSRIDLNLMPARTTQDLLKIVPGLFIAQHAGGGKAEQIFLRGFDIDHGTDIQINVDGLPVNMVSHGHGQGYADLHFVIPEVVNAIDYGKGPYYTEKGNLNTSGYVSLNTLKSIANNRLQVEVGEFNSYRALAMINLLNKQNLKENAYMASEYVYSDGPFESPQKFNRFNFFTKYNNQLNDNTNFTFSASAFSSKWNASGQIPQRALDKKLISRFGSIDNTEGGYTNRYNANLSFHTRFRNNHILESQVFYSRYNFQLYSNFTFFLKDSINGDQIRQTDERDIIGSNTKYIINSTRGETNYKTTFGINIRADKTFDTELSHTKNRSTTLEQIQLGNISESNLAFYVDEKIERGKWLINLGSRIDQLNFKYLDKLSTTQKSSQSKTIITPKVNIEYTFNTKTQLYLKAGKGFHSNDTRVVVANEGRQILPPAYGSDLGVVLHPTKKLLLNAALWYLYLKQEFVYVGDEGITEPSGRTRRFGIDLSGRYQLNQHLFADANINMAHARFIDNRKQENYIPLAPGFTSTGGLNYKTFNGFNGSLRYRFIKDRPGNEANTVTLKGYFITDAVVNYTKPKYEIGFIIENLTNAKWNEAQFDTESRLRNEPLPISELHFTPGNPMNLKLKAIFFF
ncbi:MAG TPA: TonB-dependent receptor [Segetibacter sp.]|jgi:hypothetical protein